MIVGRARGGVHFFDLSIVACIALEEVYIILRPVLPLPCLAEAT
jgi:hypothetical protein